MDNTSLKPIILLIATLTVIGHLVENVDSVTITKLDSKRVPGNKNKNILGIVNLNPNINQQLEMMASRPPCSSPSSFLIHSHYKPRGTFEKIGNISVYVTESPHQHQHQIPNFESNIDYDLRFNSKYQGSASLSSSSSSSFSSLQSQTLLIDLYDISGLHPNYLQVSDRLATDTGYKVIVPDLFQNFLSAMMNKQSHHSNHHQQQPDPRQQGGYAPNDMGLLMSLNTYWERRMKHDLIMLINYYKNNFGIRSVGILGFSHGGNIALRATSELSHMGIRAAALIHPSTAIPMFSQVAKNHMDFVASIKAPLFLMPTRDEPDMLPFYMELQKKFGLSCGHRRFEDMAHGFAGSQGNFDDPLTQERVEEAISLLKEFFQKNLS